MEKLGNVHKKTKDTEEGIFSAMEEVGIKREGVGLKIKGDTLFISGHPVVKKEILNKKEILVQKINSFGIKTIR